MKKKCLAYKMKFWRHMGLQDNNNDKKRQWKNRHFKNSLKFALVGLKTAWQEERNFRFDCGMVFVVVILAIWLKVSPAEWLWLALAVVMVLSAELWNTVIENVVDLATNYQRHPLAKKAKDIAAGIVLLNTWFAILVAGIIFLSKIINYLH